MSFNPCIIIPIYNHKETIAATVQALKKYALECIIVDDGSSDDTRRVLRKLAAGEDSVHLCFMKKNRGKGAAVMKGMQIAWERGRTHALQIDADGQHDTGDVPIFLKTAENNPDAVIYGEPVYDDSVPKFRLMSRYITHFWVCLETLSFKITDTMCGFKVYPLKPVRELMDRVRLGRRMDFDTDIMVRLIWERIPVLSVPTKVIYPEEGLSHFNYITDNIIICKMHARLFLGMLKRLPRLLREKTRRRRMRSVHWSKIQELGSAQGLGIMAWIYENLGRRVFEPALIAVTGYFFLFAGTARRESQRYLKKVHASGSPHPKMAKPPTLGDTFHHFQEFGLASLDRMASWFGHVERSSVSFDNDSEFIELARSGTGGVIVGTHLGNLELCRALARDIEAVKMNILMFTRHAARFNAMLERIHNGFNTSVIQLENIRPDTAVMLKDRIDRGELIVILGDRTGINSENRVSRVNFLGKAAPFSHGPFILASLLECPVYLMFCLKKQERYQVYFEHFADKIELDRKRRERDLLPIIQRFANRLEYHCLREPFQWFNFFNFWQSDSKHGH